MTILTHHHNLQSVLLAVDPESDWQADELVERDAAYNHFRRYLRGLLTELINATSANHGYIALSGLICGEFTPFEAVKRNHKDITPTRTHGTSTLISKYLWQDEIVKVIDFPSRDPLFASDNSVRQKLLIRLVGHGELFGFISLDKTDLPFEAEIVSALERDLQPVIWRIAEQNFSLRICLVAAPFLSEGNYEHEMFDDVVHRTVAGFAPDGVVLRLITTPPPIILRVVAHLGDASEMLLEDRKPTEGLCGRVYGDDDLGWAAAMNMGSGEEMLRGIPTLASERSRLQSDGIQTCIVMRLKSEGGDNEAALGTLSCFYRRPHKFSWRDLSLFQSFCRRISDAIALASKTEELLDSMATRNIQATALTNFEIARLVAHDLGHISYAACYSFEKFRKELEKQQTEKQKQSTATLANEAEASIIKVDESLRHLRNAQTGEIGEFERRTEFRILDVFLDVKQMLKGPMERKNISFDCRIPPSAKIYGPRRVLTQVLYNLVINSIQSIQTRKTSRSAEIHIIVHEEAAKTIIQFSDDGPGIDRTVFTDPSEIFVAGKTSKPNGTGTGLTIARIWIGRYFQGDLRLEDPSNARFQIAIPKQSKKSKKAD